jgi:hypothetical protein
VKVLVELDEADCVLVGSTLRTLAHTSLADYSAAERLAHVGDAMIAAARVARTSKPAVSIFRIVRGDACVTAEAIQEPDAHGFCGWHFACQVCDATWNQPDSGDSTAIAHMHTKHADLARVQGEPTMCNGQHGAPKCDDPFCWRVHRPIDAEGAP